MKAHVLTLRNPCDPSVRTTSVIRRRRKIAALAPRTHQPVIAYHNGRPIFRREWKRKVAHGDVVAFVVLPLGKKKGKNPFGMILSLALMAVSGPLATSLYTAMGGTFVMANAGMVISGIGGVISMAGNAIVSSAFAGKPSSPSPHVASEIAAPSPTYNVQAQGNMARVNGVIPVQYGKIKAFPDFAAQPYAEFAGNEQYLYQLFCLGKGEFEIDSILIEDTSIASFSEITYEVLAPGAALTLFPSNVVTSVEVSGQEATYNVYLGGFIVNASGTTANALAVDVVAPRGLYWANNAGGLNATSVTFDIEARTVDSGGTPTSSYAVIGSHTITGATSTPQRYSYRYTVVAGRYEVRLKRTSAAGATSRYGDDLIWVGLRAYLPETRVWNEETLIAMRMRASNSLSGQASRKVNVICTRKLPVYNGSTWSAPQVTRSPAWAIADMAKATYGGKLTDARLDLDQLVTLAADCAARGDMFDGRFDSTVTLWEALGKAGQAVRTKPFMQGGILHVARDQAITVPTAMFSMRNIVRGSFSVDYLMPTDETADVIDVGYFDEDVWAARRVSAALVGSSSLVPLKVDIFGVTQRDQAYREGLYLAAVNRYRRKRIKFATEMEGFIPSFGDLITVSHDMPAWGVSGEVTAVEAWNSNGGVTSSWLLAGAAAANDVTGPDGSTLSRAFTDDDAAAWDAAYLAPEIAVSGNSYTRTFFVKKDAVTTRFALLRLYFNLNAGGGTPNYYDFNFRTDTGASLGGASGGGTGSAEIVSWDSVWWRISITASCANGNDRMWAYLYPAVGTTFSTHLAAAVGSTILWSGPITRLTLSEPVTFTTGSHYIGLRTRNGAISGPWLCTVGRSAYEVVIAGLLDITPYTGGAEERTHFAFGKGEAWRQPARVVSIRPRGLYQVEIEAINEDASVHSADTGSTAPAAQFSNLPSLYTTPIVAGVTARSQLNDPLTILVSWQAAPGGRYYVVEVSSDGDVWSRVGETTSNNLAVPAVYENATLLRVAAFGFTLGPWVQVAYAAFSDYMWSATDTDLMWSATSTDLMWSA